MPLGMIATGLNRVVMDLVRGCHPALQREMHLDDRMERLLVAEAVRRAKEPTRRKMQPVTFRATVVHGMATPWLRTGPWIFRDEAPTSARKSASGPGGEATDADASGASPR